MSNAINNPDLLRPETLARVQDAIQDLGYLPNRAARHLRTRASHLIGLRMSPAQEFTANAAMDRFVHALVEASREAGYHLLLFSGGPGKPETTAADLVRGYDDLLRSTAVDAFIVTDTYLGNPQTRWLSERRAPFVAFGRPWDDPDATHPWVDVDGAAGVELATDHLIERGHERIAWIGWAESSCIGEDRRAGWERAMAAAGRSTDGLGGRASTTRSTPAARPARRCSTRPTPRRSCARPTPSRSAYSTRSRSAACTPAATSRVVGFDDSQVAQVVPPGLTSVRQPLEQVALELVRALEALLAREPYDAAGVLLVRRWPCAGRPASRPAVTHRLLRPLR